MPNNFIDIKNDQASSKYYLVRLNPRRVINDLLVSIGGGKYSCTFDYAISSVNLNFTTLTKVTTVTNPNEWSYDESTKELIIYATPTTANIVIVNYYIFITGGRYRVLGEDPENSASELRDWSPIIIANPEIGQSIENIIEGRLSVSISALTIINEDRSFNQYLTNNDSFNNAPIKIWICLNNNENIQKIFEGTASRISLNDVTVSFELEDNLGVLLDTCLMGDDANECYWTKDNFPNMNANNIGMTIPYMIGSVSKYLTKAASVTGLTNGQKLDPESLYDAVCTNYSNAISTSTNREWGICRVSADGFIQFGFTPSNIDQSASTYTRLDGSVAEVSKFHIGDTFQITQSAVTYYATVYLVDRTNGYIYINKIGAISTGAVAQSNNCPAIIVHQSLNEVYECKFGRDYTTTTSNTSGGNKYLKITFANNFEANHTGMLPLDPSFYQVKYRVSPDASNALTGSVISSLLTKAGVSVNSASITSANIALPVNCCFSIPQFDEQDFKSYLHYVELILKSSFGYIVLNNSFEFEYHLFEAPSPTSTITDVDILFFTPRIEITYSDIVTQLIAYNGHYSSSEATEDPNDSPSVTKLNLRALHLHKTENVNRFRHVLESINDRLEKMIDVQANRRAIYAFDTKIINIDNILGDDITLDRSNVLDSNSLKILSLQKSPEKTSIIASDLFSL